MRHPLAEQFGHLHFGKTKVAFIHSDDKSLFEAIEKNFEYWPHHSFTGENLEGGYAFEHHLWQSNDEPPLYRVESLTFDDHGQAK